MNTSMKPTKPTLPHHFQSCGLSGRFPPFDITEQKPGAPGHASLNHHPIIHDGIWFAWFVKYWNTYPLYILYVVDALKNLLLVLLFYCYEELYVIVFQIKWTGKTDSNIKQTLLKHMVRPGAKWTRWGGGFSKLVAIHHYSQWLMVRGWLTDGSYMRWECPDGYQLKNHN